MTGWEDVLHHETAREEREWQNAETQRMEQEINDCNVITWVMRRTETEGLKRRSMPLLWGE